MQTIQTDLTVLENILVLNLNISLWSARRKMTPEDFGGVELPPDDLATLGSKRIADPEKLKIFNTLKARAFNFLDRHGVRFMCGWAIPEPKAGVIADELVKIRADFFKAKDDFLEAYEENLSAWIAKHNSWADIIRSSTASSDYVRSRMDFRWQIFKVAPLMEHENSVAVSEAGLAEEVDGLGNTLFGEVARSADEIWKKVYVGKTEVTHKALSPLRTLHDKLIGLSFIEPHVAPVAEIIQTALSQMPTRGNITGTSLFMLQGLVCLLRDSDSLLLYAQKLIDGCEAADVLDSLVSAQDAVTKCDNISQETAIKCDIDSAVPSPVEEMPEFPGLPQLPVKPVLPNMGLW